MRLRCLVPFLQAALTATSASAGGSVDVTYDRLNDDHRDYDYDYDYDRALKLLGTNPDVNITYGSRAQCSQPGRRLDANQTNDADCSDPNHSWEITYELEIGTIVITSCPKDKVLKITGPNNGNVPTDDDCDFLDNASTDIVTRTQFTDKLSLEAQTVKGAELICDWPSGLSMNHVVDFDDEWNYQRNLTILFDSPNTNVQFNRPPDAFMYDEYYQSLCFALDDKYVLDERDRMAAKLNLDPPCNNGTTDMFIGGPNMVDMVCQSEPQDASSNTVNWAHGNCFGRCGEGCGSYPGAPTQFTSDCMDYDYCTRFKADREDPSDDCHSEFLHTVDDTMWSGNCNLDTKMEQKKQCGDTLAPTQAPMRRMNPTPPVNYRPVAITFAQNGTCTDACDAISGNWTCSQESLEKENWRFTADRIKMEALTGLGMACEAVSPPGGRERPIDASFYVPGRVCVPTTEPRNSTTFDCDAATTQDVLRFCTCYIDPFVIFD